MSTNFNEENTNITKTNNDVKAYIDADMINYLLEFIEKAKKNEVKTVSFKDRVIALWRECLAKNYKDKNNIIGEALNVDFPSDPEKLIQHKEEIYEMISSINNATNYEGMKYLNNGEKWSEIRQPVSMLMALGNALKLVDFKNNRLTWDKEEAKNPEVSFNLK